MHNVRKPKKDWKHNIKIAAEMICLFKIEIISVNVRKTKTDVFITIILRCFRWNLLIFIRYLCNFLFLKSWENKKTLKT